MTGIEVVARTRVSDGHPVGQLACHPRLPLIAGLDAERGLVHIWSCEAGRLRALGSVGDGRGVHDSAWHRPRHPGVAWHPHQPLLAVAGESGVVRWTPSGPSGPSDPEGPPFTARYRHLAFSPDGRTLWASPSSDGTDAAWERSDALDLDARVISVGTGRRWDTGVAEHPGGGLIATLMSDQGGTLGLFARIDPEDTPTTMRIQRRALVLDCDGYETPVFSPDGRHLAVRSTMYGNVLHVFAFPTLRQVLATTLGSPSPGYPHPREWLDEMRSWSGHNIAFGARPGVLWVGTPAGALVELDVEAGQAAEHELFADAPVSALSRTPAGELVVASGEGELVLVSVSADSAHAEHLGDGTARAAVDAYLEATSEVMEDGDLWAHVITTDGERTWDADDMATVTTASTTDPTWLRLQAAINTARDQDG
ncbi:WD40 repeat domain-containing protein [Streptomyces laurentii]|uniref:hypothetical protein n=1 Tax=Streptomyces laurentii TaxID=39478 RepID=UPI0036B7BC2B